MKSGANGHRKYQGTEDASQQIGPDIPQNQGGLGGTSLDMSVGKDRELVRRGIAQGYGITPEIMAEFFEGMVQALRDGVAQGDNRCIVSCNRTLATMVGQIQAEEDPSLGSDARIVVQFDRPG